MSKITGGLTASERLDYWLEFQKTYPNVPLTDEIAAARREAVDAEKAQVTTRIADVEREIEEITVKRGKTSVDRMRRQYLRQRRILMEELESLRQRQDVLAGM
ncbi:MAG: hypothetical protein O2901_15045 [Verrucomicrobia bacterium]|nr:hypothetical protein [Verrucomicrobiota bacterium]